MIIETLTGETRTALSQQFWQAYVNRAVRLLRRIHTLPSLAEGKSVTEIAHLVGLGEPTVRD